MEPKHGTSARSAPSAQLDIWYVSYRSNSIPRKKGDPRLVRGTRKFRTEADAKEFAQEVIGKGWTAIAGTINPHKPKKTVASKQILKWIGDQKR
jgi:hypothetical protein